MEKESCNCFTCRHRDEPRVISGYLQGYIDASDWFINWAEKNKSYIIEDDFDSEFFIPGHPIEPLYSLDTRRSVIYINTFSKSLSSSMRIGYMILPPSLCKEYDEKLGIFSCSVPVLDQYVLAEFINNGSFERHLNRERRKIKNK